MSKKTIRDQYQGLCAEPVAWEALERIFDAIWGRDAHPLPFYPAVIGGVTARWVDAIGAEHKAENLVELEDAYRAQETARITISGGFDDTFDCTLVYTPSQRVANFLASGRDRPTVAAWIDAIKREFPLVAKHVFVSYATRDFPLAKCLAEIVQCRVDLGVSVFVAKRDIAPGQDPLRSMFEGNLLRTEALLALCSTRSRESAWLWWESAAVWARGGLVVPFFLDLAPEEFGAPLSLTIQGCRIDAREDLDNALRAVVQKVSSQRPTPALSDEEFSRIREALVRSGILRTNARG